jgi:phosphate transport system protein
LSVRLHKEVEKLKKKLIDVATLVEESVYKSVKSLSERDLSLAQAVIADDLEIDRAEVDVEEDCMKILALHQPVAGDLRYIIAVLKMNNDLERIGDLAVNIAESAEFLCMYESVAAPFDFQEMSKQAQKMLEMALDSLINMDKELAKKVIQMDDQIDEINREMYDQVKTRICSEPSQTGSLIRLLTVSRNLERIADHTTNIAEDVIYMIDGEIVRHKITTF